ncbi:unnamed protein product [Clonostachys solani]|uniref:2-dehydropantoate 2-reductase n=1 Tax=Clonostachys solani TaxID=160281 RepID=A0A9N9W5S4_9HYPO|nr:unnamed protein product [Clonostachys solani]
MRLLITNNTRSTITHTGARCRPRAGLSSYQPFIPTPALPKRSISASANLPSMGSPQPPWLATLLQDRTPAPTLYSWTPDKASSPRILDDLDRRVFILGVGNLGRLYASYLSKLADPPPITLVLHRRELLEQWHAGQGIEITRSGATDRNKDFDVQYWTESPPPDHGAAHEILTPSPGSPSSSPRRTIGNIIVATKASAALPQADRLRRYLDGSSTVAFAQNGMSKLWPPHGQTYVSHRYPGGDAPNFVACITTHGVTSVAPFRSTHASLADAKVGLVLPSEENPRGADYLMDRIAAAPHLDSQLVSRPDLWVLQLEKLVINSVINPLSALLRCQNGVLFESRTGPLSQVMDRLLDETSKVLQALVRHPSSSDILTPEVDRDALLRRFGADPLRELLWTVGDKVKENTSSMLQDVRAGKPTEIRDFNGWIVDMARFLDQELDVTAHVDLIALVEGGQALSQGELTQALLK